MIEKVAEETAQNIRENQMYHQMEQPPISSSPQINHNKKTKG